MNKKSQTALRLLAGMLMLMLLVMAIGSTATVGAVNDSPASVTIAGSLQDELGCPGDWQPECAATYLSEVGYGVWRGEFSIPGGDWEYRMALNDSWDVAYPVGNKPLSLGAPSDVRFYFDDKTSAVIDSVNDTVAVATGSFQKTLGCLDDWQPWCVNTLLSDVDGDGVYTFVTTDIPEGPHEVKVALDEAWTTSYPGGGNYAFQVNADGDLVTISYDTADNSVNVEVTGSPPPDPEWVVAGTFQDDWAPSTGCGDWNNTCLATGMEDINADGVYRLYADAFPTGAFLYKVVQFNNWDNSHPGTDVPFISDGSDMRYYFQSGDNRVADNANQCIATAVGTFQETIGGSNWSPDNLRTMLWQEEPGSDWYSFTGTIPAGEYEYKVARDEAWGESYPIADVPLDLEEESFVTFRYNCATNEVGHSSKGTGAGQDNDIWWNDLGHNSRDEKFRTPAGPVPYGTEVTVRLRAASNDLTAAKVRLWDDLPNVQSLIDMTRVADDGTYEWWEATLPASPESTVYWYRFIAIDGTATAYYEDDEARDNGWGKTYGDSPDQSWQLTMYDPAFQTPDWVKNAVIYQLFPDRFRDGDSANNPPEGRFFYDELDGTIVCSETTEWNTAVCDPRDETDCPGTYSLNFYGGDLQGVTEKISYLQGLGVTALYFNPLFASPSNHKYDTADYGVISEDFGDLTDFNDLVAAADAAGIDIILDGVFNHTSSDSKYFDRYSRFDAAGNVTSPGIGTNDGSGACESPTSPYRDWYYFTDVTPGAGSCVGSDGTPLAADYESWFGYDSLPKMNATNPDVRAMVYDSPDSVNSYWLNQGVDGWRFDVGGDVDPGKTNDPTNDFWEEFRANTGPDDYMVIEEWGNATPWLLGEEMDATMNYQYSSAMLSFWRDTTFSDNDHNSGSSAGELVPLSPSQLDARLQNWIERYPPEALYAMMNLLGSHDTNRALFMLDHNAADAQDDSLLQDPAYDWSDAMTRLKGVALLQMTLPGAPTIYYGDEVGLVGPTYFHGAKWEDDPYNRQPYPWDDETGTPFYTHLQSGGVGHTDMLPYYQSLTAIRNDHPALRTGSFDTLLVDDGANVYAYGRLLADYTDAAVVLVNRAAAPQDITVDVAGYLPAGVSFTDALNGGSYSVDSTGQLTVPNVPGMNGAILVADSAMTAPPAAVNDLAVTGTSNDSVDLGWSAAAGADSYDVYRSLVSGGGYEFLGNTSSSSFSDSGLTTGVQYYYVVVSKNDTTLLAGELSNEVQAIPAYVIGWANLQWPPTIDHIISTTNRTENIFGQVWIDGVTELPGATSGLLAQVGYGPSTTIDDAWSWEDMDFNVDAGNNDEYRGSLLPDMLGTFCYTTRYSGDGGVSWVYGLNGPDEGNFTCPGPFGVLTVNPSADTTAPAAPQNLLVTGASSSHIAIGWDAHPDTDGDLAGFEIVRDGLVIAQIADPLATSFSDDSVATGVTYTYEVQAYDTSFNRSALSNSVSETAEPRMVTTTFRVGVPAYTPGTVYIVGDIDVFGPWNPGKEAMTQIDDTTWEYTSDIVDGTAMQYKFTRGSWNSVESWGSIIYFANREVTIDYGTDGIMLVDMTATDWGSGSDYTKAVKFWRDPIVVDYSPADGTTDVPWDALVTTTWSIPMELDSAFEVSGPAGLVAGTFAYDELTQVVTFTPDAPLLANTTYDVLVAGAISTGAEGGESGTQEVPAAWSFTTVSVEDAIEDLMDEVQDLVDDGTLNKGQGNALTKKLRMVLRQLDWGRSKQAINALNAFINQVEAYSGTVLPVETAAELIAKAEAIIAQIEATITP